MRASELWKLLSLDLGDDPQRSIPLFQGLSKHRALVAALMTSRYSDCGCRELGALRGWARARHPGGPGVRGRGALRNAG
jgi:hypothetical protein